MEYEERLIASNFTGPSIPLEFIFLFDIFLLFSTNKWNGIGKHAEKNNKFLHFIVCSQYTGHLAISNRFEALQLNIGLALPSAIFFQKRIQ